MLDYRTIIADGETARAQLARRGYELPLERLADLDAERRATIGELEAARHQLNEGSARIGEAKRAGGADDDVAAVRAEMASLGETIASRELRLRGTETSLHELMLEVPNRPADHAPDGDDESSNTVVRTWGEPPTFAFEPRSHHEIGEAAGLIDVERGVRLAGSRFSVLWGLGTLLERALANLMFDAACANGYTPVSVPYMVLREAMTGTGQLPKFEDDLFRVTSGDREHFLIPTAEVPVTNLHADEILDAESLPRTYCAETPCFRAEAGSAGRDVRGLLRQHQFEKVELVRICRPDDSWDELEALLRHAEGILQLLGLHYRVVALSCGDLGFSARFTYDIEAWLPGQDAYREISSCSSFGDFQARRANIRFRDGRRPQFVHTLNGSALPIGRTLIALIEQYQTADGGFRIPEALRRYIHCAAVGPDGRPRPG